jgi:beta-glucosidase
LAIGFLAMNTNLLKQIRSNISPVSRQAAVEGIVLLKNEDSILPIKSGQTLSLFGRCQVDTYRSGTGSGGAVNVPYSVNALQGLRDNNTISINEELAQHYERWISEHPFDDGGGGWAAEPWFQKEMELNDEIVHKAAQVSDKAVVFIGRTAGEDKDNANEKGSYRLTDTEQDMVTKVTRHFSNVILVLNVTNIINMSWVEEYPQIKAIIYSWAAGMEGGHALADILSGDQSPSGRLTDTIAFNLEDYPSSINFGNQNHNFYEEDIYVGYRYFETFAPEAVQYEFGFGLSYSQFCHKLESYSVVGHGSKQVLNFKIKVTNIGDHYSSKEVVQLYVTSPQGALGKPTKALIGFVKTSILKPGESEVVSISVPLESMASYDDSGVTGHPNCYLLEQGTYDFYVGSSIRQVNKVDVEFVIDELLVTEQLTECAAPILPFVRLKPGQMNQSGYYSKRYEPVPQRTISLAQRIQSNMPHSYPVIGDCGFKLLQVKQGRVPIEEFISQMTPEQLATLIRGEGMCSPKVTPGTASAFGGVSQSLFEFGIPVAAAADGPSGIRMDTGHQATQVPIGTLLACTWNKELNEQLFYLIGQELAANRIDTLLGPGINIHRHPLNGRNFEYFSEDPFISGVIAVTQTRGLSRAGVSGTIKHFAANDQESFRVDVDSVVSERALREIHLKSFEMAVKQGSVTSIMTAYNPVNGHWAASNYDLNTTILREEWGFRGIVMTDWWAKMNNPIDGGVEDKSFTSCMIRSQNDLYMVVENDGAASNAMGDDILASLDNGSLTLGELQRSAINICRFLINTPAMDRPLTPYEPIKYFSSYDVSPNESLDHFNTDQVITLNAKLNTSLVLWVKEDGIYKCVSEMSYGRNQLAQSSCSLSLNHQYSMSLATNGTEGNITTVEGLEVKLENGYYLVDISFIKPGLVLKQISFINSNIG